MRRWRTPLIYCSSLLACFLAGIAIDLACGGEMDPYDYYISFFHNNLQGEKEYNPFYFTEYQFVYDETEPVSEAAVNSAEWATYLGRDVSDADVNRAMYKLSSHTDSVLASGYLRTGEKLPDSLSRNTFLKAILLRRNAGALKYYRFAKGVESLANVNYDPWNPKPVDSAALRSAGTAALKAGHNEKDKFIQLRYCYQAQRLLHYSDSYKEALNVYDKYLTLFPNQSHVKGWALALRAGELRRLGDTVRAAYLFARVFAQYPERRVQAYRNYRYINAPVQQVLALAANDEERAVIYAIEGFGDTKLTLDPLQKVYRYAPASPMVGVLLVREINKLENSYLSSALVSRNKNITTNYYIVPEENQQNQHAAYIKQLIGFCRQLSGERRYPDYNIAKLAAAYLEWMQGDNANGFAWLRALNGETLSPAMNDQKEIIRLLLASQNIQTLNDVSETLLLPALKWLDGKVKAETKKAGPVNYISSDKLKFTITARNFYEQVLAPAYLKQGDTTKAALVLLKSADDNAMYDFWGNNLHSGQINRLIRMKKVPPVSPYLNFLAGRLSQLKLNYLDELLGTAYLREHQYAKAISAFKLVDATSLNKFPEDYEKGDPFIDRINDYPKVLRYGKTKGYNKLQFAIAMNELEQKVKTDPQNASTYYYRYATGLYNTSHYGNAWYLISYNWYSSDFGRPSKYSYDVDYVRTSNAEKYYLMARSLSNNEELKAKCTFMAAKSRQKQFVMPDYYSTDADAVNKKYFSDIKNSIYFDELREKYRKTSVYKKALGECSYLKDFVLMSK